MKVAGTEINMLGGVHLSRKLITSLQVCELVASWNGRRNCVKVGLLLHSLNTGSTVPTCFERG